MNYEFHVGDYVETVDGAKGYICDANKDWWRCTNADDEYSVGYVYRIVRLGRGGIHECYNRIGTYDFTKKEKKEIGELEDIENIDVKDWLPVFVVHCIRDCVERMATGKSRWFTAYSSDYTTHTFDEYEAAMYLQDLIDEKFGNRRHHR